MQDIIPDALIAAFERHYDCSWDDPALRNERLAWRAAWAEATKPCLLQITEPQAAPAAVAVPDEREAFEQAFIAEKLRLMDCSEPESATHAIRMCHLKRYEDGEYPKLEAYFAWFAWQARAALAATPAAEPDSESVLIDGTAYDVPAAVAGELLRLHLEILAVTLAEEARTSDAGLKRFLRAANDAGITHLPKSFGKELREHLETAAAQVPQGSYVSTSGELKPDVSVYSTPAAAPQANAYAVIAAPVELLERVIDSLSSFAGNKPHTEVDMTVWEQLNDLLSAAPPAGWKLVPMEPTAEMLESAGATDRDGIPATYKTLYMAMVGAALNPPHACDTPRYCNSVQRCTAMDEQRAAAAPVVLPEPGAWSESLAALVAQVDAGSTADYRALQEHRVMRSARALLAQAATTGVAAPASLGPALYSIDADPEGIRARVADAITGALAFGAQNSGKPPAGHWLAPFWTQARFGVIQFNALRDSAYALLNAPAVEQGEVLVTVSGFTGSGKSAIAGEIEILCRALGLQVQWPDGDSEKNMTHADWTAALEQYKPCVRIVEQNIPFASKKGLSK